MRYVALVVQSRSCWTVLLPDFPGMEITAVTLQVALWKAHRQLVDRAIVLNALGVAMRAPMNAADLVSAPGYERAMAAIIAIPGPLSPDGGNVFRFG